MKKYGLRGLLTIAFSFGLIHFIIGRSPLTPSGGIDLDTGLRQAQADSLVDSVRLTPDGFRKVLLQRNELAECKELQVVAAKKVRLMEMRVDLKNVQITSFQAIRDTQAEDIKKLKRLVWKKNVQIGGLGGLVAVFGYRLIFR